MPFTRRDLLKRMINPGLWADSNTESAREPILQEVPAGQDLCIAWGRGVCDRCDTACPDQAIIFVGMLHPRIIAQRCTLCGDCVPVCPTHAIVIRPESGSVTETGDPS